MFAVLVDASVVFVIQAYSLDEFKAWKANSSLTFG